MSEEDTKKDAGKKPASEATAAGVTISLPTDPVVIDTSLTTLTGITGDSAKNTSIEFFNLPKPLPTFVSQNPPRTTAAAALERSNAAEKVLAAKIFVPKGAADKILSAQNISAKEISDAFLFQ